MAYTLEEDKYIYKCATTSRTICHGLHKAAKELGRTEKAVMYRYYNVLKKNTKKRKYNERVRTDVLKSVAAKKKAKDPFANAKSTFSMSKHQKMLDQDVRFTLASLAKDHDHITIEVKGKQITAVFK